MNHEWYIIIQAEEKTLDDCIRKIQIANRKI